MDPTLVTRYVASSPSSTCMPTSPKVWRRPSCQRSYVWRLHCPHTSWDQTILDNMHETIEKCISSLDENSSNPYKLFLLLRLTLPLLIMLRSTMPKLMTLETLDVAQVLFSMVRGTWILFLPFLTLHDSSFLSAFFILLMTARFHSPSSSPTTISSLISS